MVTLTLNISLAFISRAVPSVNIFGGFIVSQRMLSMFKKKK